MSKKGASLLALAINYNINLAKLLEYNDLTTDGLLPNDQLIFLEKKSKVGDKDIYIVTNNETLYDISQNFGIRLENVVEYNISLEGKILMAGTSVNLRPGITITTLPQPVEASSSKETIHNVQPNEGLYVIAKKYGVSVNQLKDWNKLQDVKLKIGQQLIIIK